MICGISSCGGGNVTDVNAGYALEEFVRTDVFASAGINEHAQFYQDFVLDISNDNKLCRMASAGGVAEPLTLDLLRELNLKHLSWKKEHGLDGICFEEDKSNNFWYVDLWQCKGGRWDVEIGGGINSMTSAVDNYKKRYQLKDVLDEQITEIVIKAQVGVCLIVQALRKAIPAVIIRPRRLIVTTTKQCSVFCKQTLQSWQNAGGVRIEKDVLARFGMISRTKSDAALKYRFEVRVESGCNWVVNAVPDASLRSITSQLLFTSTTAASTAVSPTSSQPFQRSRPGMMCSIQ